MKNTMINAIKKGILSILILSSVFLFSCTPKSDKPTVVFMGSQISGNDMYTAIVQAWKEMAEEKGFNFLTHDAKLQEQEQINGIETYIARKVDVLMIDAINPSALDPYVQKAMEKGIKIIASGVELLHYDVWGTVDQVLTAEKCAEEAVNWIDNELNGKADIAILNDPKNTILLLRDKGFANVLSKRTSDINVVATATAVTAEAGMTATENILQANPSIKIIIASSGDAAVGAVEAIKGMGLADDKFGIFTINGSPLELKAIADGTVMRATVRFQLEKIPTMMMDAAEDLINDENPERVQPVEPQVINSTNVRDFL